MRRLVTTLIFLGLAMMVMAQEQELQDKLKEERFETLKHMLDYRFKGGSGEFEHVFFSSVSYPENAQNNCIIGTTILSFTVSCDNKIDNFSLRNPLHYGINEEMQKFLSATVDMWNTCSDDKYTKFEVPILFTLKGTETGAKGFLTLEVDNPGFSCKDDSYYMQQFERLRDKKKVNKALKMLDMLIRRDPYNTTFYDMKRDLLESKKDK